MPTMVTGLLLLMVLLLPGLAYATDRSIKYVFKTSDRATFEAVQLWEGEHQAYSMCMSAQAGITAVTRDLVCRGWRSGSVWRGFSGEYPLPVVLEIVDNHPAIWRGGTMPVRDRRMGH